MSTNAIVVKEIGRIVIELKDNPLEPLILERVDSVPFKVVIFIPEQDGSAQDLLSALPGESITINK